MKPDMAIVARLAGDPRIRDWLQAESDRAVQLLKNNPDTLQIYRAQGRAAVLDEIIALIDKAKSA